MAGDKFLYINAGTVTEKVSNQTSAGAGDAGKVVALNSAGLLDETMMPPGVVADTKTITASEALAAGDLVNVFNSSGVKVRKADASTSNKEAHGYVLAAVLISATATVYFEGNNNQITGATPGDLFLSTTPGLTTSTAPSGSGNVVQRVGFATAATSMNFQSNDPIVLA